MSGLPFTVLAYADSPKGLAAALRKPELLSPELLLSCIMMERLIELTGFRPGVTNG